MSARYICIIIAMVSALGVLVALLIDLKRYECSLRGGVLVRGAWLSLECVQPARAPDLPRMKWMV